jgi:hypothetical protein
LPRLVLAPIIGFIATKYDAIPEARRKQLQKITKEFKENSSSALEHLKGWFQSIARHDKTNTTKKSAKTVTKKSSAKKSPTLKEKISNTTRSTAKKISSKAKETTKE